MRSFKSRMRHAKKLKINGYGSGIWKASPPLPYPQPSRAPNRSRTARSTDPPKITSGSGLRAPAVKETKSWYATFKARSGTPDAQVSASTVPTMHLADTESMSPSSVGMSLTNRTTQRLRGRYCRLGISSSFGTTLAPAPCVCCVACEFRAS